MSAVLPSALATRLPSISRPSKGMLSDIGISNVSLRAKRSNLHTTVGDCFVAKTAPRNDKLGLFRCHIRRGDATVDHELRARHVGGLIRGKVERGLRHLFRLAEASHGNMD